LVALWREALLAQKVLQGETKGYRSHPQLTRFRQCPAPLAAVAAYLRAVHEEAGRRGYTFDSSKIGATDQTAALKVTQGQLEYEWEHLKNKLRLRDPERYKKHRELRQIPAHPLFIVKAGEIELWERV
jgi:hypothetical protein